MAQQELFLQQIVNMKNLILIIIHIIVLYIVAGDQITILKLKENIRVKASIIYCYEHGEQKSVRTYLKKNWRNEF